jgi:hypothetical protein
MWRVGETARQKPGWSGETVGMGPWSIPPMPDKASLLLMGVMTKEYTEELFMTMAKVLKFAAKVLKFWA